MREAKSDVHIIPDATVLARTLPENDSTTWFTVRLVSITFNHMVETTNDLLDGAFHALADATRRRILRDTSIRECTVGELARPHGISLAAISKHIKVLETARLVARRKQGSYQWVRIEPNALRLAAGWLAHYEQFWNHQLDSLQNHLEGGTDQ